jgi:hypothetical protein
MSYQQLGDMDAALRKALELLGGSSQTGAAIAGVAADPYFPEAMCHLLRANNIAEGRPAGACRRTPPGVQGGGVGLRHAILPLRAYVEHVRNPWLFPLLGAVLLAGVYQLGVNDGRKR